MDEIISLVNNGLINKLVSHRLNCRHIHSSLQILKAAISDMEDKCRECQSGSANVELIIKQINDIVFEHDQKADDKKN